MLVLTWLWSQEGGRTKYTAGHVNIWAAMVRRHLSIPHRIACVTDMPAGLDPSIEIIAPPGDFVGFEIPTWSGCLPNCFRRLALFRPDAAEVFGSDRIVSMDTDCVIAESLDPLLDRNDDMIMYRGTNARRPYNGSMLLLTAGCRPQVFSKFSLEKAVDAGRRYVGSDQAWISYILGWGENTWGPEDGVAWYGSCYNTDQIRVMFFPGVPKPWKLVGSDSWITEHYRGDEGGRCIIIGVSNNVWEEVREAVSAPYDAVIAFPEASELWSGPIREVVTDRREAEIVARMHGFEEIVLCGVCE